MAALGALGLVLTEVVKGRNARNAAPAAPPTEGVSKDLVELYERTAVHNVRLDDADERHDVLDRTVDTHGHRIEDIHTRLRRAEKHLGFYSPEGDH